MDAVQIIVRRAVLRRPPDVSGQVSDLGERPGRQERGNVSIEPGLAAPHAVPPGGRYLIAVNAAVRKETGLGGGDTAEIGLALDTSPRTVEVPADLAAALDERGARAAFDRLTASRQRRIVTGIEGSKTAETRTRRIERAVSDVAASAAQR